MTLRRVVKKKRETGALRGEKRPTLGVSEDGSGCSLARREHPVADRAVTRGVFSLHLARSDLPWNFSFKIC